MKYRVVWHSLLVDGQIGWPIVFHHRWTARLSCWLFNHCPWCSTDQTGQRIRWFSVQRL